MRHVSFQETSQNHREKERTEMGVCIQTTQELLKDEISFVLL